MRENGVRRVRVVRGSLELEAELDPAAQYLPPGGEAEEPEGLTIDEKRAKSLCLARGCDKPGGHMGQPFCRTHFLAEMNGAQTT